MTMHNINQLMKDLQVGKVNNNLYIKIVKVSNNNNKIKVKLKLLMFIRILKNINLNLKLFQVS